MPNDIHTHIYHHVRESVSLLVLRIFVPLVLLETGYLLLIIILWSSQINTTLFLAPYISTTSSYTILLAAQIIITIFLLYLLTKHVISWAMTEYYLTEHELIILHGTIRQHQDIFDLSHTRTIKLHQSWFGKLFNYGTIEVTLAGSGYHETALLKGIVDPKLYENTLRQHIARREEKK